MLTFNLATAPQTATNNAFAAATTVTALPFTRTGLDTRAATTETGETVPSCTQGIARTVWFRYVAPADATLSLDTLGSDFDTVLGVYRGTALDALTQVACSDDIDAQAGNQLSRAEFGVSAGETYYLQAGGYYDTIALGGALALSLTAVAPRAAIATGPSRIAQHLARGDVQLRRRGRHGLRVLGRRCCVRALHLAAGLRRAARRPAHLRRARSGRVPRRPPPPAPGRGRDRARHRARGRAA